MGQRIALKTALVTGILALLLAGTAAAAPTVVVQNGNDSGAGSLRKAIEEVDPGGTIVIPASVGEISLTSGQLEIFNSLTIEGAGPGQTTISAGRHSRVIIIKGSPTVTIEGVQIAEGKLDFPGQGVAGAGIDQTGGNVTVANSLIDENEIETGSTGFPYGAGIASSGATSLTLRDTVVSDNRIHGLHNWGAGVNVEGANLTIEGGSIKGNTSEGFSMFGGGLYFDGTKASLSQVAITGNEIRPIGNVMIQGQGAGMEIVEWYRRHDRRRHHRQEPRVHERTDRRRTHRPVRGRSLDRRDGDGDHQHHDRRQLHHRERKRRGGARRRS